MVVFFRTQDHLIRDDGQLESAWGGTKTWPAMFLLVVAAVSAVLSIGTFPCSFPSASLPSCLHPSFRTSASFNGSDVTLIHALRKMGQPLRDNGRKFHDRCLRRLPTYLGHLSRPFPQQRSTGVQCPEYLVLGL